jgi:hypothetical protein
MPGPVKTENLPEFAQVVYQLPITNYKLLFTFPQLLQHPFAVLVIRI